METEATAQKCTLLRQDLMLMEMEQGLCIENNNLKYHEEPDHQGTLQKCKLTWTMEHLLNCNPPQYFSCEQYKNK